MFKIRCIPSQVCYSNHMFSEGEFKAQTSRSIEIKKKINISMLAAQKPSSLTTSMKGGEMEEFDSLPEQAEFPTLTNVIRNIGNEFDHLLKSLKEGDQEKVKTLVTVLPPKDLRSLMESEPILTVELGNLLNTIAAPVKMDK